MVFACVCSMTFVLIIPERKDLNENTWKTSISSTKHASCLSTLTNPDLLTLQVRTSPMCWAKPVWCLSRGHSILLVKECSSLRRRRKVKVNPCIHQCWHVPSFLLSFIPSFCSSFVHTFVFCSFSRGKDCVHPAEVHVPSMHPHTHPQVSSSEVTDGSWYMRNRQSFENEAGGIKSRGLVVLYIGYVER